MPVLPGNERSSVATILELASLQPAIRDFCSQCWEEAPDAHCLTFPSPSPPCPVPCPLSPVPGLPLLTALCVWDHVILHKDTFERFRHHTTVRVVLHHPAQHPVCSTPLQGHRPSQEREPTLLPTMIYCKLWLYGA